MAAASGHPGHLSGPAGAPDGPAGGAARRALAALDHAVRELPPSSFAFVMATGILSTGCALVGADRPSGVLAAIAVAAGVLLAAATAWRAMFHRGELVRDLRDPSAVFGFFTIVAAANVVGLHYDLAGNTQAGLVLALAAAAVWLLLTYWLPCELLLRERTEPVMQHANGSWFLWVVATQSLATATAVVGTTTRTQFVGAVATGLWGVGMMLYLLVATLVTLRLLTRPHRPESLSPTYWIYMGATAITVLAGSRILAMPAHFPVSRVTDPFVAGASYVLWAMGMWLIPLLVLFGIWRHGVRCFPLRYETSLWSIVFPLGMFSAATIFFGRNEGIPVMVRTGEVGVWVAAAAWAAATVLMVSAFARWLHRLGRSGLRA
ncbi:tellurite resistance/C4-dicarboxylate transporter family protein [Arthrobacter sp. I2-34]|uniref:Tellurite resistance/C4-dicarboxylate transporter family protein n=1 Tax=Arthrobacter hankyongi TaxID=2904801 RepID=A0ABS9L5D6_9MICC|nr:tellurite resistance/C4-dicarboxylate transporter family protein [Arthrobacter hankyongi]MCG2621889.1 tellurite resistance/C4-dicarboxylate transporter family protein [Arthrobacter hankyongi]